jgi:hypothetical protein
LYIRARIFFEYRGRKIISSMESPQPSILVRYLRAMLLGRASTCELQMFREKHDIPCEQWYNSFVDWCTSDHTLAPSEAHFRTVMQHFAVARIELIDNNYVMVYHPQDLGAFTSERARVILGAPLFFSFVALSFITPPFVARLR